MLFNTAAVALLAGAVTAAPTIRARNDLFSSFPRATGKIGTTVSAPSNSSTPAGGFKSVVYWGQSVNKNLEEVCKEEVDTVVMAFVNKYGNETKNGEASAEPGWQCSTDSTDSYAQEMCKQLGKNVTSCHDAGKKVLISIGGWIDYSTMKSGQGKTLADSLWEQYAETGDKNVLGGVALDGFDFDIEHDNDNDKLAEYVETAKELRSKIGSGGKQILTGAPMCVPPAQNVMTKLMKEGQFDELYFQFYNNAPCGVNDEAGATAAWDQWYQELQGGASKSAKMFLGMLGGKDAGMSEYFLEEPATKSIISKMKTHKGFAGAMTWDAGYSMNTTTPSGNFLDSVSKALGRK